MIKLSNSNFKRLPLNVFTTTPLFSNIESTLMKTVSYENIVYTCMPYYYY